MPASQANTTPSLSFLAFLSTPSAFAMSGLPSEQVTQAPYDGPHVSKIARRIHGWSWQAFPIGMGTSAVYLTLSNLYHHYRWVTHLEVFFYFLNIALFLLNTVTLVLQLLLYRNQFKRLLFDPVKGIFVPLIVLSFATILIGTINYTIPGGHLPRGAIYVMFWVYVGLSVLVCFPMLMIWFNKPHDINEFTPAYAFLIFPMMLVGVVSLNVLRVLDITDPRAIGVLLTGYFFQGIGSFMTFFYLNLYILRIMNTGFLQGHQANGAFVACGPPGFTAFALIKLGESAREILPRHDIISENAGEIWYAASILAAFMLFGLAVFFFFFGILPYPFKLHKSLGQILGCWAVTFPNVGWITSLKLFGDIFNIPAFYVLHEIMAVLMCTTWLVLIIFTGIAFFRGKILISGDPEVARDSSLRNAFVIPFGMGTPGFRSPETRTLHDGIVDESAHGSPIDFEKTVHDENENEKEAELDRYYSSRQDDIERPSCSSHTTTVQPPESSSGHELRNHYRAEND